MLLLVTRVHVFGGLIIFLITGRSGADLAERRMFRGVRDQQNLIFQISPLSGYRLT
ncbi:hypothetical protein SAICODRAFT_30550 [Saitoella complicata NRRL Y-17804]|uniref:uncharacterized protein n=1 Tax=Saitoella complicata (strain BCRC 22490 / CBS 7301 / JCM 7358 / NBRC 10748 / NRRL Y-17804) TaxID=698492 RepID=UPI0008671140|nr:uncharacterized protein SAICODRAFT_30550 [Saitoella complicata NRRL Y-17804]ODQ52747.1 hypothetical protein SAICODRAFT_30550 [Saitoella complicata NRRL Y-17804]